MYLGFKYSYRTITQSFRETLRSVSLCTCFKDIPGEYIFIVNYYADLQAMWEFLSFWDFSGFKLYLGLGVK